MVFAQALECVPTKKNEVSGLMIMGLFGGTVFPLFMGLASDAVGQAGAVAVMAVGVVYFVHVYKEPFHKPTPTPSPRGGSTSLRKAFTC